MVIQLNDHFKDFLKLLNLHQVRYLVVGGYAVGVYGYPLATADLDVWIALDVQNADSIVTVVRQFGFDIPQLKSDLFLSEGRIIRMGMPPDRIEILTSISGVTFSECYSGKVVIEIEQIPIPFISREQLIVNKQAAGRLKDRDDVEHLSPKDII